MIKIESINVLRLTVPLMQLRAICNYELSIITNGEIFKTIQIDTDLFSTEALREFDNTTPII